MWRVSYSFTPADQISTYKRYANRGHTFDKQDSILTHPYKYLSEIYSSSKTLVGFQNWLSVIIELSPDKG